MMTWHSKPILQYCVTNYKTDLYHSVILIDELGYGTIETQLQHKRLKNKSKIFYNIKDMKNSHYIFQYLDIKALTAHAVVQCKAIFQLTYASSEVNWTHIKIRSNM